MRWTAPEVLATAKWVFQTDVYSYGVLLFEVYSKGKYPFADIPDRDLIAYLAGEGGLITNQLPAPAAMLEGVDECIDDGLEAGAAPRSTQRSTREVAAVFEQCLSRNASDR